MTHNRTDWMAGVLEKLACEQKMETKIATAATIYIKKVLSTPLVSKRVLRGRLKMSFPIIDCYLEHTTEFWVRAGQKVIKSSLCSCSYYFEEYFY